MQQDKLQHGVRAVQYVNPIVNKSVDEDNSISVDISALFGAGGFTYAAQTDNDEVSAIVSNSNNTVTLTGSQNWLELLLSVSMRQMMATPPILKLSR